VLLTWAGGGNPPGSAELEDRAVITAGEEAMKSTMRIGVGIVCLSASLPAWAALMYEGRSTYDGEEQVYTSHVEGQKSRMGAANSSQYMLMNWKEKTLYAVDTTSRQATDMSMGLKQTEAGRRRPRKGVRSLRWMQCSSTSVPDLR